MRRSFKLAVLAIASVLAVTACGGNKKTEATVGSESVSEAQSKETSAEAATEEKKKDESSAEASSEANISAEDLAGVTADNVYTNKALNLKFDATANDMRIADQAELEAMGIQSEGKLELYAYNNNYTKIAMIGILDEGTDLKTYMDEYIETTKKNNESLGEDALKIESTTTKLMDKDVPAIVADLTMGGVTQYTTQAFVEVGGRIYTIATITTNAEESSKGLDMFTKAE
jgi:lipoprotein|nr:hypothetical protein [uncultured Lachnoanaerobaculum sp.]